MGMVVHDYNPHTQEFKTRKTPGKIEKSAPKQKENINVEGSNCVPPVGHLSFDRKCMHISRLQETGSKPGAVLSEGVQRRDFTKCKWTENNVCSLKITVVRWAGEGVSREVTFSRAESCKLCNHIVLVAGERIALGTILEETLTEQLPA